MTGEAARFSFDDCVQAAGEALASGRLLMADYLELEQRGLPLFPLVKPAGSLAQMAGYFGQRPDGTPLMGCLQRARFAPPQGTRLESVPFQKVLEVYRDTCSYRHPDGLPGGFTYTPIIVQRSGSRKPEAAGPADLDFSLNGLDWLVVRVDIHDFAKGVPALRPVASFFSRRLREAALLLIHRDFSRTADGHQESLQAQCCFGYSFLPLAPEPNPFGFGPGNFGAAVKRFRFQLRTDGGLDVELMFTVSPRSERILNLGGFDPVYSTFRGIDRLTFRLLTLDRRAHDRFDRIMLRIHGRVHHNLLQNLRPEWEERAWEVPKA